MKWMKQAARNLVAMAAALCLLLPCAVPASAESLQTPVWMQAWGGTRTAGVVGQLEQAISLLSSASSQVKLGSLQQARYDARIDQLRDLQARFRPYQKM